MKVTGFTARLGRWGIPTDDAALDIFHQIFLFSFTSEDEVRDFVLKLQ